MNYLFGLLNERKLKSICDKDLKIYAELSDIRLIEEFYLDTFDINENTLYKDYENDPYWLIEHYKGSNFECLVDINAKYYDTYARNYIDERILALQNEQQ